MQWIGAFLLLLWVLLSPPTQREVAVAQTGANISILDFGGKAEPNEDNTDAFNAAIRAASSQSRSIYFPCGVFRFARKPESILTGIRLEGCGSVGSTPGYGSALVADYDENSPEKGFLTWNGGYGKGGSGCCAGTGGGIERIAIYKGARKRGGTAIKITGLDDAHRAGYSTISDVLVGSTGGGTWDHNLIIDGSCCTTLHTQGVRDTYINNFWAAQAVASGQSILLRSAVQVFWHGGEIMPAGAGSNSGITITGGSELTQQSANILISDIYIVGNLSIANARSISFRGLVGGDATVEQSASGVVLSGLVGGKITNRSATATIETNQLIALPAGSGVVASSLATGTSAATDLAGQVRLSGGHGTYKFARPYSIPPICLTQDLTSGKSTTITTTNQELTIAGFGEDVVNFVCVARN